MTNERIDRLTAAGYSTKEIEEQMEHEANAPAGSYYANALAFVVESIVDDNAEDLLDIALMDRGSLMEFADQYNTTLEMIYKATRDIAIVKEKLSR